MIESVVPSVKDLAELAKAIRELGNFMDILRQNVRSWFGIVDDVKNTLHIKACSSLLGTLADFKESPSAFLYNIEGAGGRDLDQLTDDELQDPVIIRGIASDAAVFSGYLGDVIEEQQGVFEKGWIQGGDTFLHLREALAKRRDLLNQLQALDAKQLDPEALRTVARAYKDLAAQLNKLLEALRLYIANQQDIAKQQAASP